MHLTPGQLAKVRQDVMRRALYLHKLTDRMYKLRFPIEDPMPANAIKARDADYEQLRSIPVKAVRGGWQPRYDPPAGSTRATLKLA